MTLLWFSQVVEGSETSLPAVHWDGEWTERSLTDKKEQLNDAWEKTDLRPNSALQCASLRRFPLTQLQRSLEKVTRKAAQESLPVHLVHSQIQLCPLQPVHPKFEMWLEKPANKKSWNWRTEDPQSPGIAPFFWKNSCNFQTQLHLFSLIRDSSSVRHTYCITEKCTGFWGSCGAQLQSVSAWQRCGFVPQHPGCGLQIDYPPPGTSS